MVEKFETILREIKQSKGELVLFALMKMDEITDRWTIILSAPWAKEGDLQIFKYILDLIRSKLSQEELSTIARIGIYSSANSLVKLVTGTVKTEGKTVRLQNTKINGFSVQDAYIFQSLSEQDISSLGAGKEILTDKETLIDQPGMEKPKESEPKKE